MRDPYRRAPSAGRAPQQADDAGTAHAPPHFYPQALKLPGAKLCRALLLEAQLRVSVDVLAYRSDAARDLSGARADALSKTVLRWAQDTVAGRHGPQTLPLTSPDCTGAPAAS